MVEVNWTMLIQILNMVLLVGIIYLAFFLIVKLPKNIKSLKNLEKQIEEIKKKIDN
ncbi:hypothetical protein [Alkaliphilus serpentinus]|uniref:hypothetical protein n=1 Tax=Alkaliphilus serpentinus TaxID=1482731 RepID=UPI0018657994|nr:hypothetical protein [Alkaliphilus serpentinus]